MIWSFVLAGIRPAWVAAIWYLLQCVLFATLAAVLIRVLAFV